MPDPELTAQIADHLVRAQLTAAEVCAEKITETLKDVELPGVGEYRRGYGDGLRRAILLAETAAREFNQAAGEIR